MMLKIPGIPGWIESFVKVHADRKFGEKAQELLRDYPPALLDYLASTMTPLSQVLKLAGYEIKQVGKDALGDAKAQYLMTQTTEDFMELLRKAVPEHARVLERYPAYQDLMARDIRTLLIGEQQPET